MAEQKITVERYLEVIEHYIREEIYNENNSIEWKKQIEDYQKELGKNTLKYTKEFFDTAPMFLKEAQRNFIEGLQRFKDTFNKQYGIPNITLDFRAITKELSDNILHNINLFSDSVAFLESIKNAHYYDKEEEAFRRADLDTSILNFQIGLKEINKAAYDYRRREAKDPFILEEDVEYYAKKYVSKIIQQEDGKEKVLKKFADKNIPFFGQECMDIFYKTVNIKLEEELATRKLVIDKTFGEMGYEVKINNVESVEHKNKNTSAKIHKEDAIEVSPQSDAAKTPVPEAKKVLLKLPAGLNRDERRELEDALYKAGARYLKETIPAEKSNTGKEVHYKSWYVMQRENTDMTPFVAYIRPERTSSRQEAANSGQKNIQNKEAQATVFQSKEETEKQNPEATASENKIYLNLPHVGRTAFSKIIAEISQNGAKFDGAAKAWYITDKADFNKFKTYLGLSRDQVVNKRESVLNKLNENKAAIESRKEVGNEISKGTIQRDELSK